MYSYACILYACFQLKSSESTSRSLNSLPIASSPDRRDEAHLTEVEALHEDIDTLRTRLKKSEQVLQGCLRENRQISKMAEVAQHRCR